MRGSGLSIQFGRAALILSFVSSCLVFSPDATAQDSPVNVSLRDQWDGFGGSYADVWADGMMMVPMMWIGIRRVRRRRGMRKTRRRP